MASQFKIPKRKHPSDGDSAHTQSPLAHLHRPTLQLKSYCTEPNKVSTKNGDRMPHPTVFRDVVKTLLGISSQHKDKASSKDPTHKAANSSTHRDGVASNGWRPHRASDRLCKQEVRAQLRLSSPPQRKVEEPAVLSVSVDAVDTLAMFREQRFAGKSQSKKSRQSPEKRHPHSTQSSSDEEFVLSTSASNSASKSVSRHSPEKMLTDSRLKGDIRKRDQQRRLQCRTTIDKGPVRYCKRRESPAEPIVLSSEEEKEEDDDEEDRAHTSQKKRNSTTELPGLSSEGDNVPVKGAGPACLQLDFSTFHIGLTEVKANGKITVTENGLVIPVKVSSEEEGDVTIVASQLRGYGIWDGGMASRGTLLAQWEGPSPSLIFLWVTDAQARLLQRELSAMMTLTTTSTTELLPCCCLLLVMKEQLKEIQAALLASMLDLEEYRKGRSSSSSCCSSPVAWADGLMLVHSCPAPMDEHLLSLLGHSDNQPSGSGSRSGLARRSLRNKRSSLDSSDLENLPNRLIQYPPPPSKGRLTVTKEDLACLDAGEFLNDVIIDFYLKFLLLEGVDKTKTERSHVFSSFFYKQLSRRRVAGEDSAPSVPNCHTRHQRVKTWTRHVDIFTKDFLFVPVNQEAHWFLVVVCFPGLEDVKFEEFHQPAGKLNSALRSHQLPQCTQKGCTLTTVLKRPCILVMDSLKMSNHENVSRLLREYLQVEWKVRRGTTRIFTVDNMRSSSCRVPQQDNSSDCGLYLLQYAQSFLQNPVVNFELPCRLDLWFPRQLVRQKRKEIRHLILKLHNSQRLTPEKSKINIQLNQNTV